MDARERCEWEEEGRNEAMNESILCTVESQSVKKKQKKKNQLHFDLLLARSSCTDSLQREKTPKLYKQRVSGNRKHPPSPSVRLHHPYVLRPIVQSQESCIINQTSLHQLRLADLTVA